MFPESYSDPELELKKHIIKYGPGFCYMRPLAQELQVVAARVKNSNIVVESGGILRLPYGQLMRDFNDEIFIEQGGIFIMDINSSIENIGDSTLY